MIGRLGENNVAERATTDYHKLYSELTSEFNLKLNS